MIRGEVEKSNERGICISDDWYNYSKWHKGERAEVGDEVEIEFKADDKGYKWIQSLKFHRKVAKKNGITDKDVRITRLSLISSAVELVKKNGKNGNPTSVIEMAREFEKYVYERPEDEDIPF